MPPIPGELLVVVFGTLVSYALDLGAKADVEVVGTIHAGFPHPAVGNSSGVLGGGAREEEAPWISTRLSFGCDWVMDVCFRVADTSRRYYYLRR